MHVFDQDCALKPESRECFSIELSPRWGINNSANGGYIMAVMARAMSPGNTCGGRAGSDGSVICDDRSVITANYIERCLDLPARILVENIGESGNFIRKQARLIQDDKERVRALGTFVKNSTDASDPDYEADPPDVAPWDECIQVPFIDGYSLYQQMNIRMDPVCAGWLQGKSGGPSVIKGWIEFEAPRRIDAAAVTLFADAFPPSVLASHGMVAWVPTIEYSVNIRALPDVYRLKGVFATRFISSGMVEEDGQLWDETGTLVALSRQIAKFQMA